MDAHGGEPSVQQAAPLKPHVFDIVVPPVHDLYAATSVAQFASIADFVAASSVTPSVVHLSCVDAQLKYVWKAPPHFASPARVLHWATSLDVGGGAFGQDPAEEQMPPESELEQPAATTSAAVIEVALATWPNSHVSPILVRESGVSLVRCAAPLATRV